MLWLISRWGAEERVTGCLPGVRELRQDGGSYSSRGFCLFLSLSSALLPALLIVLRAADGPVIVIEDHSHSADASEAAFVSEFRFQQTHMEKTESQGAGHELFNKCAQWHFSLMVILFYSLM